MNRTAKLYGRDGKLVIEIELPRDLTDLPDVIFYQARAFQSLLVARGNYTECILLARSGARAWRARGGAPIGVDRS